jgi:hypothetical protein
MYCRSAIQDHLNQLGAHGQLLEWTLRAAPGLNRRWQHFNMIRHVYTNINAIVMITGLLSKFLIVYSFMLVGVRK